ncbi:hypothetical protein GCM10007855_10350 [Aliivibrio sifiae]|uniref:Uncharacterized protein n=1 Tax=Aliivibrio sifiae TaxID=566293 RepID=A0ABQ6AH98_9GAMM|nr:hypothetical protein GCM10007855_10350 [Aliivibrio sifiae]
MLNRSRFYLDKSSLNCIKQKCYVVTKIDLQCKLTRKREIKVIYYGDCIFNKKNKKIIIKTHILKE